MGQFAKGGGATLFLIEDFDKQSNFSGEKTYDPRIRPSALNSSDGPTFIKVDLLLLIQILSFINFSTKLNLNKSIAIA